MKAQLRNGQTVEVKERHLIFNTLWQKHITDFILTPDGTRIPGKDIVRLDDDEPPKAA